jgi:hypothetical protein
MTEQVRKISDFNHQGKHMHGCIFHHEGKDQGKNVQQNPQTFDRELHRASHQDATFILTENKDVPSCML